MAALNRAFTLPQIHGIAELIGQQLDFDVARVFEEFLNEHAAVTEAGGGFGGSERHAFDELLLVARHAHALAPAPGGGFDHHRVANFLGELLCFRFRLDRFQTARHNVYTGFLGDDLRLNFIAHRLDGCGGRADQYDATLFQRCRKFGILRQEAIAGMHRIGTGLIDGGEDIINLQVAMRRGRRADINGLIGFLHMQRVGIRLRVHRDRTDAHLAARAHDTHSNLTTIRNQYFLEHGHA